LQFCQCASAAYTSRDLKMTQRRPHLALLAVISLFALCSSLGAQVPIREGLKLNEIHTHDPWILADQASHTYYLYNSAGPQLTVSRHCGILAYKSRDLETWSGPYSVFEIPDGSWANPAQVPWAPEVHLYSGRYYLFTTLHNQNAQLPADASAPSGNTTITVSYAGSHELHPRGTQVFVADSPLGPFKAIADAPIPPRSYTTLDGTLWVEDAGSTNGTLVNSKRISQPMKLRKGDRVQVGATVLEAQR